jgi:hypothetical protein
MSCKQPHKLCCFICNFSQVELIVRLMTILAIWHFENYSLWKISEKNVKTNDNQRAITWNKNKSFRCTFGEKVYQYLLIIMKKKMIIFRCCQSLFVLVTISTFFWRQFKYFSFKSSMNRVLCVRHYFANTSHVIIRYIS